MARFVLSAFADEAGSLLSEQIAALVDNEIDCIEPRNVNGKSIIKLTEEELYTIKAELDNAGIKVNSLGSPIGKFPIEKPLSEHLPDFENALRACEILGTKNMRIFSFYVPKGEASEHTEEVVSRLTVMAEIAKKHDQSIGSIVMRWHLDTGVTPVFTSRKASRIREYAGVENFRLDAEDIARIGSMNLNYKLYLESMLCPGF